MQGRKNKYQSTKVPVQVSKDIMCKLNGHKAQF